MIPCLFSITIKAFTAKHAAKSCLVHTSYRQKKVEIVKTGRVNPSNTSVFQPLKIIILVY